MSQPSATKHLKTVEAALGEPLVERDGRASRLTDAGLVVADHAVRVLETLHGMQQELVALRDAERGTLTLAASTTPGTYLLPPILRRFADRHPKVDVEVVIGSSSWVAEAIARREIGLGIAGEMDLPDGVTADPLIDDELVGVAARGRLTVRRGKASPADLSGETLLVREPGSSTRAVSERHLARMGLHVAKRWELDSNEAIKRSVRAGLGVGFLSMLVVTDEVERGELVAFRLEGGEPMRRSVQLLRPADREPTPAEAAFMATLGDHSDTDVGGRP